MKRFPWSHAFLHILCGNGSPTCIGCEASLFSDVEFQERIYELYSDPIFWEGVRVLRHTTCDNKWDSRKSFLNTLKGGVCRVCHLSYDTQDECQRCMGCLNIVHHSCLMEGWRSERQPVCCACGDVAPMNGDPPPLPPPEEPPLQEQPPDDHHKEAELEELVPDPDISPDFMEQLQGTGSVPCEKHGMDHLSKDPTCEFCKKALGPMYRHLKNKYGSQITDHTPTLSFDFSGPLPVALTGAKILMLFVWRLRSDCSFSQQHFQNLYTSCCSSTFRDKDRWFTKRDSVGPNKITGRKPPAPIKKKSALPPPPQKKPKYPPAKTNGHGGFSVERKQKFQAPIKLAHPFPAPDLRTKFYGHEDFSDTYVSDKGEVSWAVPTPKLATIEERVPIKHHPQYAALPSAADGWAWFTSNVGQLLPSFHDIEVEDKKEPLPVIGGAKYHTWHAVTSEPLNPQARERKSLWFRLYQNWMWKFPPHHQADLLFET